VVQVTRAFFNRITLPGFQGLSVGYVMAFFRKAILKGSIQHRAAAMTYRVFFALIPLLLTLFAAISFMGISVRVTVLDFIQSMVPSYVWPAIENMINGIVNKQNGTLLSFSLLFSIFTVLKSINTSINILNKTFYDTGKRTLWDQLRVTAMILMIWAFIILLAIGVFVAAETYIYHIHKYHHHSSYLITAGIRVAKWLLLFTLVYLFISTFYYFAPAKHQHFKFFSVGSTFATIAMVLVLAAMNIFFSNFSNYNALYGSLGAVFAILMWFYWNHMFILIGYDLNVSIATAKRSSLRTQIKESQTRKSIQ
jgi:membrane protein